MLRTALSLVRHSVTKRPALTTFLTSASSDTNNTLKKFVLKIYIYQISIWWVIQFHIFLITKHYIYHLDKVYVPSLCLAKHLWQHWWPWCEFLSRNQHQVSVKLCINHCWLNQEFHKHSSFVSGNPEEMIWRNQYLWKHNFWTFY